MDPLARFVGIMMVFVMYITVSVEGAAYGEDCASAACADANNICDTGKTNLCICDTGFFRKTTPAECAAQVALNTNCDSAQTASDQCSKVNSECRDDSGTKCLCKATHYETGGACVLKIALNAACTDGHPADQCEDTLAECRDQSGFKCLCKTSYFENKDVTCAAQVSLDGTCKVTDSATDQCSTADTECRDDGAGSKCLCKDTHYSDGSACVLRIKPNIACTAAGQCVTHATCDTTDTDTCVCKAGYTPSPIISPTMCSGVVIFAALPYMYVVPILASMMFLLR